MTEVLAGRIRNEAEALIALYLAREDFPGKPNNEIRVLANTTPYPEKARDILSLSGETDETCRWCNGAGRLVAGSQQNYFRPCTSCKGEGIIKHRWSIVVQIIKEGNG